MAASPYIRSQRTMSSSCINVLLLLLLLLLLIVVTCFGGTKHEPVGLEVGSQVGTSVAQMVGRLKRLRGGGIHAAVVVLMWVGIGFLQDSWFVGPQVGPLVA